MKKILLLTLISGCSMLLFGQVYTGSKTAKTPEEKLNEEYCSGLFKSYDGTILDLVNNNSSAQGYMNILDWLQGRVAGLQVYTNRNNDRIPYIRNSRAGIYVDEVYRDADFLNLLPVADIAMIKVIKGPFAGGMNSPGGVIAIYTIVTDDEGDEE